MVWLFAYVHGVTGISLLLRKKIQVRQYSFFFFFLSQKLLQEKPQLPKQWFLYPAHKIYNELQTTQHYFNKYTNLAKF